MIIFWLLHVFVIFKCYHLACLVRLESIFSFFFFNRVKRHTPVILVLLTLPERNLSKKKKKKTWSLPEWLMLTKTFPSMRKKLNATHVKHVRYYLQLIKHLLINLFYFYFFSGYHCHTATLHQWYQWGGKVFGVISAKELIGAAGNSLPLL